MKLDQKKIGDAFREVDKRKTSYYDTLWHDAHLARSKFTAENFSALARSESGELLRDGHRPWSINMTLNMQEYTTGCRNLGKGSFNLALQGY